MATLINDLKTQSKLKRFHSPDDIDSIWQVLYPEHFINVLLIHHIKRRDEVEITEIASIMRDGLINHDSSSPQLKCLFASINDELYQNKFKTSKISDMFESFQNEHGVTVEPQLILIDAAPGMGKTTLCKEIAYQWANKKLLIDTKMLFLLFLRDPAIQKLHDLKDFIHYFYNFEPSYLNLSKECAEILTKRNNSDITIVMDGYDELGDKSELLLINNIIKRNIISQCKIVITSRPIASEKLQKLADVRVEILGFTDQSKGEYIQKELKDFPIKVKNLLSYLEYHGDINKVCYIPIMMTILVCSFKEYGELPTNQSELYERFVTLAILRCLHKLDNTLSTSTITSLSKLPERYQIYLKQLSEFAFKTIESDKVIFNNIDIEGLSPNLAVLIKVNKELQGLGLFKATEHLSIKKMDNLVWYNFLHLSIHEFLAAYYLKSLNHTEQFQILKQTFFVKRYINVWVMFVGLQQNVTYDSHLCSVYSYSYTSDAAKDKMKLILQKFNVHYFARNISIENMEGTFQFLCCKNSEGDLQTDVIRENFATTSDFLLLLHSWPLKTSTCPQLFISLCNIQNNKELIEIYLINKNTKDITHHQVVTELEHEQNLSVMLVSSSTLVGYRSNCHQLTNALNMNKSLKIIVIRYCLVNNELANILSQYFINYHRLRCLIITNCEFTNDQPLLIILQALIENSNLQVLNLSRNNMKGEVAKDLANVIKSNLNLKVLLYDNNLKLSIFVLIQALRNHSKLKILSLTNNNMTGKVAEDLANVIKNNSDLEGLYLSGNALQSSAIVILRALKDHSALKALDFSNNNMTGQVAEDLAYVIKNNSELEELYLSKNGLNSPAIVILRALKDHSKLKSLNLNDNNMTGQVAEDLANVIKNNSDLEGLHLSGNDLQYSAIVILQALKDHSKLKVLDLNNNSMTVKVAEDLAYVIKNNSDLQGLYLSDNNFKSSANLILQALKDHSKLKVLDLNNNSMTIKVAKDLAYVIKNNPDFERICLSGIDLKSSAIVILQALKDHSKLKVLNLNNSMTGQVAEDLANVIKKNTDLKGLHLSGNDLKSSAIGILQALKDHSKLKVLNLSNNSITGQVAEELANVIKNNSDLEELYLSGNDLKSSAIKILQALKYHSKLKLLNLNNNNMTGQVAEDLAYVIKNNPNIRKLYLSNNGFKSSAVVILQALKHHSKLKNLSLHNNNMTGQVAEDLAYVIRNNLHLKKLYLSDNSFKSSAIIVLQALKDHSELKVLNLNNNNMTGQVAQDLAYVVKNNANLRKLYLSNNSLKSSAVVILQALKDHSKLKTLSLHNNNMTGQVAEDLAYVIRNNLYLKKLYLSNNGLKSSVLVILQALKDHSKLKTLSLHNNNMTGQVAEDLANVIKNNLYLEKLYLSNNSFKSSAIMILQALKDHSELKGLDFNNNGMTGKVAEDLAYVIKNNSDLEGLYLSGNDLKSSAIVILQALKYHSKLKVLSLANNNITGEVAEDLAKVMKNNSVLEELYLSNNNLKSSVIVILRAFKDHSKLRIIEFI